MPNTTLDPEYGSKGRRKDGRNLVDEWKAKTNSRSKWSYVWNETEFNKLDVNKVDHVLGKMNFEYFVFSFVL